MKFISAIYMSRRNFWCMTRGGCQQKIFHLQKGDGGQSGSQDLMKTVDLSGKTYISSISDPKGTAFRGIHFWFRKKCFSGTPYSYSFDRNLPKMIEPLILLTFLLLVYKWSTYRPEEGGVLCSPLLLRHDGGERGGGGVGGSCSL